MNKFTITEGNKILARFMGGRVVRTEEYEMPHGSHSRGTMEHWEFDNYHFSRDEYASIGIFKFERDWNDLMAVIDKIEQDPNSPFIEICGRRCEISHMINHNWPQDKAVVCNYNASNSSSTKEAVWLALVHYINELTENSNEI